MIHEAGVRDGGQVPAETQREPHRARTGALVVVACVAAAALYFGREFFVPLALALLLNVTLRPTVRALKRAGLPEPAGAAVVVVGLVAALGLISLALAQPVQEWLAELPARLAGARERLRQLREPFQKFTDAAAQAGVDVGQTPGPVPSLGPELLARAFGTTAGFVSGAVGVLLLLLLMLASGGRYREKLIAVARPPEKKTVAEVVDESESVVLRYLLVTAAINLGQAVLVGVVLWVLGMPQPVLWGVFTFVLEFIPYVGGAVMVGLLAVVALVTFDRIGYALLAPASYLVISTLQNNLVSPLAYGRGLRLHPVAILVGVLFWGYLWGAAGAFLAVPILAAVKVIADHGRSRGLTAVGELLGE